MADRARNCRRCRRGPLQPSKTGRPGPDRVIHKGRGLCGGCYAWCERHQQLDRFPTEKTPPTDHAAVVDAYLEFADKGLSKTDIATRIGVGRGVMYAALDADPRTRNHARRLDPAEAARLRRSVGARC